MLCRAYLIPHRMQKIPERPVVCIGKQADKYIHIHSRKTQEPQFFIRVRHFLIRAGIQKIHGIILDPAVCFQKRCFYRRRRQKTVHLLSWSRRCRRPDHHRFGPGCIHGPRGGIYYTLIALCICGDHKAFAGLYFKKLLHDNLRSLSYLKFI